MRPFFNWLIVETQVDMGPTLDHESHTLQFIIFTRKS